MRKLLITSLLLVPSIAFADFKDVSSGSPYENAVNSLQSQGVIGGYPDGTFRQNQSINRAELMKIIVLGALKIDPNPPINNCFSDVSNEWFASFVCFAHTSGWVQGYSDGTFRPSSTLTQAEALKMIIVSIMPQDTNSVVNCDTSQWYGIYVCQANRINLLENTFNASGPMTRGMAAEWIYLALQSKGISSKSATPKNIQSNYDYLNPAPPCDLNSWTCTEWGICDSRGMQQRNCTQSSSCSFGQRIPSPSLSQTCLLNKNTDIEIAYLNSLIENLPSFNHGGESEKRLLNTGGIFDLIVPCQNNNEILNVLSKISQSFPDIPGLYKNLDDLLTGGVNGHPNCPNIKPTPSKQDMLAVIDHGKVLIKEMKETALELAIREGNMIFDVSNKYVPKLNEYINSYNLGEIDVFRLKEQELQLLEDDYMAVPRNYCRADWCK